MIPERYKNFLLGQAHADEIRHSGRCLYDHLVGTHDLLRDWHAREEICRAGLFHSIYGTVHFRSQAWPLTDRTTIRNLIGEEAEALVYMFCVIDRPRELVSLSINIPNDTPKTLRDLREIEAANLIDQGGGRWLKALHETDISAAAKQAIARHLEANDGLERRHGGERRAGGR